VFSSFLKGGGAWSFAKWHLLNHLKTAKRISALSAVFTAGSADQFPFVA
jgi:hypothetical protein